MKLLCIGNSFSQDATRYLHGIARAGGVGLRVSNLCIGGCPLSRHYRHMLGGDRAYEFELNGVYSGLHVSLDEVLLADDYDAVTFQQLSSQAPRYETYQPYLSALADHVRDMQPHAKLYMHETWAYEEGSHRLTEELGYKTEKDMTNDLVYAYIKAASAIRASVIPAGRAFDMARQIAEEEGRTVRLHRDTYHASLGLGRYILGLTMFYAVTGKSPLKNTFRDFEEPISEEDVKLAQFAAENALRMRG